MRRSPFARAAILLLVFMMPLGGARAAAASCCVADCELPCCDHDDGHSTMVPVLPCCHPGSIDQASTHPAPTVENDSVAMVAPTLVAAPIFANGAPTSVRSSAAHLIPAPPLYHQHCALLL